MTVTPLEWMVEVPFCTFMGRKLCYIGIYIMNQKTKDFDGFFNDEMSDSMFVMSFHIISSVNFLA